MNTAQVVPLAVPTGLKATHDVIVFSHQSRKLLWWLLVSLQLLTATLLALLANIYFTRDTPNSLLWTTAIYFIFADGYDFINRFSFTVATGYTVLGAAFAFSGLRLVWFSIQCRRLSFGAAKATPSGSIRRGFGPEEAIFSPLTRLCHLLHHWSSIFSVHGPRFDERQLISKTISLASQTTAAYLSSRSISNVYLNQTYGLVIFLNGISTLAFSILLRRSRLTQRFACLLSDAALDFVWGCILPLWMHLPIIRMYRSVLADSLTDGESSVREISRVFVLSWPSYLLSIIPFVNSFMTLMELQTILRDDVEWHASPHPPPATKPRHRHRRWVRCAHVLFVVSGSILLGISLAAAGIFGRVKQELRYGCRSRLHPWFSTKEACVKRTIDCAAAGISGSALDLEAALRLLDEDSLIDLSLSGCNALDMPTMLTHFTGLQTLIVDNSSISSWDLQAGLTDNRFTNLKTVMLLGVNTTATLDGFVAVPIAKSIEYIRFHDVPQAATILGPVANHWQHLIYFDCDSCNLTELPSAVDEMYQLLTLSLAYNRMTVLRDDFITRWDLALIGLWMDGNTGLTELSDVVWRQAATCDIFKIQNTDVSVVPEWLPRVVHSTFFMYAYGTPLCEPDTTMSSKVREMLRCDESVDS